jgi:hypothetical protein
MRALCKEIKACGEEVKIPVKEEEKSDKPYTYGEGEHTYTYPDEEKPYGYVDPKTEIIEENKKSEEF